VLEQRRPAH